MSLITQKDLTFNFFNFKWKKIEKYNYYCNEMYYDWYLKRYSFNTMENLKKFLADKKFILDAGCGVGRDSGLFAKLNPKAKIIAIDQSYYAIKKAKNYLKNYSNCQAIQGDILETEFENNFDFISCDQTLHHTPSPNETIKHLMKFLNSGGVLNFSVCRRKNEYRDFADDIMMNYCRTLTPEQLWDLSEEITKFGKIL